MQQVNYQGKLTAPSALARLLLLEKTPVAPEPKATSIAPGYEKIILNINNHNNKINQKYTRAFCLKIKLT